MAATVSRHTAPPMTRGPSMRCFMLEPGLSAFNLEATNDRMASGGPAMVLTVHSGNLLASGKGREKASPASPSCSAVAVRPRAMMLCGAALCVTRRPVDAHCKTEEDPHVRSEARKEANRPRPTSSRRTRTRTRVCNLAVLGCHALAAASLPLLSHVRASALATTTTPTPPQATFSCLPVRLGGSAGSNDREGLVCMNDGPSAQQTTLLGSFVRCGAARHRHGAPAPVAPSACLILGRPRHDSPSHAVAETWATARRPSRPPAGEGRWRVVAVRPLFLTLATIAAAAAAATIGAQQKRPPRVGLASCSPDSFAVLCVCTHTQLGSRAQSKAQQRAWRCGVVWC
ncbi:uncharacterized protein PSFLO_00067 [Pseudozyma flocculosa]|uniref:Uncharacterized protein n=1 Tax=Pseudozyma flocculosa TaxID=84751 RepID=A0A5C3ESW3_9BASI|nr:uncharacterized protein PSFLO_00067 [Pseudozyma flocculosa]